MKQYNSEEPLIYIHIPKCAGTSMIAVLRKWFGKKGAQHYHSRYEDVPPPKHELKPGMCIYGHFNNNRGIGVADYYPGVNQFVTHMREPLEIAKSSYFHWKIKRRAIRIKAGKLKPGDYHDYKSVDDFFTKRPTSPIFNYLPRELTEDNFTDILETNFVYIGIVEDLQVSMDVMAEKLGFPSVNIGHVNLSQWDEQLSLSLEQEFIRNNRFAYAIYDYALKKYKG